VYELHPHSDDPQLTGVSPDYTDTYTKAQIAAKFPLFLKDIEYFRRRNVDPQQRY
jgi:hypothetical protein